MPLTQQQTDAIARLSLYNSNPYDATLNPQGLAAGGALPPADNFINAVYDVQLAAQGVVILVGDADGFASDAADAQAAAITAQGGAEQAETDAITAQTSAETAQAAAEQARDDAQQAVIDAGTAAGTGNFTNFNSSGLADLNDLSVGGDADLSGANAIGFSRVTQTSAVATGSSSVTLPGSPADGDRVHLRLDGDYSASNATVGRNSNNINGSAADLVIDQQLAPRVVALEWDNAASSWVFVSSRLEEISGGVGGGVSTASFWAFVGSK
ncbi:MAG: hypothetical protein AAF141_05865 [Pseudomonadota bacterium]